MRGTRKFMAMLVVSSGVLLLPAVPANADTATVSVTPNTGLTDGLEVTVNLSGWRVSAANPQEPAQLSLIQCDIGSIDTSTCQTTATEEVIFFDLDGSGNATALYTVETISGTCDEITECALFAIENPSNFGGPTGSVGNRSASFSPLAFAAGPVIPEVPINVLLPLGAAVMLGAGTMFTRRRRSALLGA